MKLPAIHLIVLPKKIRMDHVHVSPTLRPGLHSSTNVESKPPPHILTFIHSTGGEVRQSNATKSFIRSHVLRNYHRKKRLRTFSRAAKNQNLAPLLSSTPSAVPAGGRRHGKRTQVADESLALPISSQQKIIHAVYTHSDTRNALVHRRSITNQIDGHDPFSILPISSTPRTHEILHNSMHFKPFYLLISSPSRRSSNSYLSGRAHTFRTSIYAGTHDFVLSLASASAALSWTVLSVEA